MPVTVNLVSNIPNLLASLDASLPDIVFSQAEQLVAEMRASMETSGGGRVYHGHVASLPGQAPAIDTGDLSESLQIEPTSPAKEMIVFTDSDYAAPLEFGTVRMAARPFFTPACEKIQPEFQQAVSQALADIIASSSL